MQAYSFRPLSGNLLSLQDGASYNMPTQKSVFVPYRGIYFLYLAPHFHYGEQGIVFVPYRGIYFLYQVKE